MHILSISKFFPQPVIIFFSFIWSCPIKGLQLYSHGLEREIEVERERGRGFRASSAAALDKLFVELLHSQSLKEESVRGCLLHSVQHSSSLAVPTLSPSHLWWIEPNANLQSFYMSMLPLPEQEHTSTSRFKMSASEHPASSASSQSRLSQISAE